MTSIPEWKHYRVIHSKFPPKNLFDVKNACQNLLLAELEGMTSDRLHRWREFVSPADYRDGDGWGAVMASFCYVMPGRFNTAGFGAYYCADSPHTAISEWSHHKGKVWRDFRFNDEASAVVRSYVGSFKKSLIDLRTETQVHEPDNYAFSQAKGQLLKSQGEFGIIYQSVRHSGGVCAALLRPPATSPVRQSAHYNVLWDGGDFISFAKLGKFESL